MTSGEDNSSGNGFLRDMLTTELNAAVTPSILDERDHGTTVRAMLDEAYNMYSSNGSPDTSSEYYQAITHLNNDCRSGGSGD